MRRAFLILFTVCCLLLLAACRVPGAVRPTVRIGLVAPFEGRYRYVGYDLFPAVRLALREANEAGGVGEYYVELVAYDDGADPTMAVQQARKLAVDPDVVVAMGHFREETTAAALGIYAEVGMPLVAPAVLDPRIGSGGEVVRWGPDAEMLAAALLEGVTEGALVTQGGPLGAALRPVAERGGVLLDPVVSPGEEGWLETVLAAAPPVVLCDADPVTAGEVVGALRAAGWTGEFRGGPELAAADFVGVGGSAAEGARFLTPWPLPGDGGIDLEFTEAYGEVSGGVPPGPLAFPAYEATRAVLTALQVDIAADGVPSREGMVAALKETWQEPPYRLYWYRIERGAYVPEGPSSASRVGGSAGH
ncbi:MAG TPA: ABC transporter substrate-binding protein [Thermoflexia bacterium]|nr:ABC transporter substrate-binding protein [Thermoflexia bacterium]